MLKVGLTGGIGSGKTTVAQLFAQHGAPIVDADVIAKEITEPGKPAFEEIVKKFGPTILTPSNALDRKQLRAIIFRDPLLKEWLEQLLHPLIKQKILDMTHIYHFPYMIIVIPLLVESNAQELIDRVLLVEVVLDEQIKRTARRDQSPREEILRIISSQAKPSERLANADEVIYNNGSLEDLEEAVARLHKKYLQLGSSLQKQN